MLLQCLRECKSLFREEEKREFGVHFRRNECSFILEYARLARAPGRAAHGGEGVGLQPSELDRGWRLADTRSPPARIVLALEPDYCTGQSGLRALW